jgi:hypothetical protein
MNKIDYTRRLLTEEDKNRVQEAIKPLFPGCVVEISLEVFSPITEVVVTTPVIGASEDHLDHHHDKPNTPIQLSHILKYSISKLQFTERLENKLRSVGIRRIGPLSKKTESELRGMGFTASEIAKINISLGIYDLSLLAL